MLINLTITSLFTSSLASSPLFSTGVQYKLDLCQFNKIFPIVFYQTPKLNVHKTQFFKLQSELIIINSEDVKQNQNYSNSNIANVQVDTSFIQCRFCDIGKTGISIGSVTATFKECLFYACISTETNSFFSVMNPKQLNIIGCCFSGNNLNSAFFRCQKSGSIYLERNIIVDSQLSQFISSTCPDFLCKHCNISSNKLQEVFRFENSLNVVVDSTQFSNNELLCLIYDNNLDGKIDISSIFSINNIFGRTNYGGTFKTDIYAILYIYCTTISLTNSVILTSQTTLPITLFASINDPPSSYVTIADNNLTYYIATNIGYQGAVSTKYENNKDIYNEIIPTTVVSINSYLYYNYRHECKIYLYPTSPFTESSIFSPSLAFTPSSHFTASSKFSPSSTFTASSKFTRSASFTASSEFTASSAFTPSKFFTSGPPVPSASPSVNATYGVVGAFGTAIISFGISSIIWLSIRRFCIYDHDNYLHMDV